MENNEMNRIIEKIQNLLALANSSNENEASIAANMANKLLTKYNLSLQQIEKREKKYGTASKSSGKRKLGSESAFVTTILADFFFVRVIYSRKRDMFHKIADNVVTIIGEKHNVMIAEYVLEFLTRAFQEGFKEYRKKTGCPLSSRKSYYYGVFAGLHKKLKESRVTVQQETGLVLVEDADLDKHIEDNFNTTSQREKNTFSDKQAVMQGMEDGKNINIARGMGGGEQKTGIGEILKLGGK